MLCFCDLLDEDLRILSSININNLLFSSIREYYSLFLLFYLLLFYLEDIKGRILIIAYIAYIKIRFNGFFQLQIVSEAHCQHL